MKYAYYGSTLDSRSIFVQAEIKIFKIFKIFMQKQNSGSIFRKDD